MRNRIPKFKNEEEEEEEERAFWATHDFTDYINWDKKELNAH